MTVVGSAFVEVKPLTAGFGPETEAAIRSAVAGITANIEINLDATALRSRIEAAVKEASTGIDAKVNTTIKASGLREKIEVAAKEAAVGAQVELPFDVDPTKLLAETEAAIKASQLAAGRGIQLPLDLDFSVGDAIAKAGLAEQLDKAIASTKADLKLEAHVDNTRLRAETTAAAKEAGVGQEIRIPITAERGAGGAGNDLENFDLGRAHNEVFRFIGIVSAAALAIPPLIAGLEGLAGAAISAASALGSVASVAATVPVALSALGQGLTVAGLAVSGIAAAYKQYVSSQKQGAVAALNAGGAAASGAASQAAAARSVRDAIQGVTTAQEAAATAAESSARSIARAQEEIGLVVERNAQRQADAEDTLVHAQRNQQQAQENLTRTREQAVQQLEDLRRSVERLTLSEAQARQRLAEATQRQALAAKRAGQDLTGVTEATLRALERQAAAEDKAVANSPEKAVLDLADAQLSVKEAVAKRVDEQNKLNHAEQVGIDGTDAVVAAQDRLLSSNEAVIKAQRDIATTARDNARSLASAQAAVTDAIAAAERSQVASARAIRDAQERLADAYDRAAEAAVSSGGAAAGAANAYQAALDALAPAQRRFVEFLVSLRPRLLELQASVAEGFLPGLEEGIRRTLPLLDLLEPVLVDTAKAMGQLAVRAGELVSSPAWRTDLVSLGRSNIVLLRTFGETALAAADGARHITLAAVPLSQHLADLTLHFVAMADAALGVARTDGRLGAFFDRVQARIDKLILIAEFTSRALSKVFTAASPAGDAYIDKLVRLAARFDLIIEKASRSGALGEFFERAKEPTEALFHLLGDLLAALGRIGSANLGGFTNFVNQIDAQLLPALEAILSTVGTRFLPSIVGLTTAVANLLAVLLRTAPTLQIIVDTITLFVNGVTFLLNDIPVLSPILLGLVSVLGLLAAGLELVKFVQKAKELEGFVKSLSFVENAVGRLRGETVVLDAATGKATQRFDAAGNSIGVLNTKTGELEARAGAATKVVNALGNAFVIGAVILAAKAALDQFLPSVDKAAQAVTSAKDPVVQLQLEINKLNKPGLFEQFLLNSIGARDQVTDFGRVSIETFTKIAETSAGTAQRIVDDLRAQGRENLDYEAILRRVISQKALQGTAEADVSAKVRDAEAALRGVNAELERHEAKLRDATNRALDLASADIDVRDAFDRLTSAVSESSGSFDINEPKGRATERAFIDLNRALDRDIELFRTSAEKGQADADVKNRIMDQLIRLRDSGYPGAAAQAQILIDRLNAIHNVYSARVDVDINPAINSLNHLITAFNQTVTNIEAAKIRAYVAQSPERRAIGGRVLAGSVYLVGEKRPELFIPDTSGYIIPRVPRPDEVQVPLNATTQTSVVVAGPTVTDMAITRPVQTLVDTTRDMTEAVARLLDSRTSGLTGGGVTVTQTFEGPLVTIDATFGPGSSASDIIEAMRAIARNEVATHMTKVLDQYGAGVGTRQIP